MITKTSTELQVRGFGKAHNVYAGLNMFMRTKDSPNIKQWNNDVTKQH